MMSLTIRMPSKICHIIRFFQNRKIIIKLQEERNVPHSQAGVNNFAVVKRKSIKLKKNQRTIAFILARRSLQKLVPSTILYSTYTRKIQFNKIFYCTTILMLLYQHHYLVKSIFYQCKVDFQTQKNTVKVLGAQWGNKNIFLRLTQRNKLLIEQLYL